MTVFLTGSTGYLGSYLATLLLRNHKERLALLVRAPSNTEGEKRLWKSLQLHMEFDEFQTYLRERIDLYLGDLTSSDLGLLEAKWKELASSLTSVIHCAASLNRKSAKACFNVNLRGTLQVIKLVRAAHEDHGVRRFSDISTVAVAGKRQDEIVTEEKMIDWDRSDYDPYARTKKFCEHMLDELLPDVPTTVFRPSIILGDSRFPETPQFDMVRAFVFLARLPILPFRGECRADIVPADYVSKAVVEIHQKNDPLYASYNLSAGSGSMTYREILRSLNESGLRTKHLFVPWLQAPFSGLVNALAATPRSWGLSPAGSLMKVFLPYLTFNTVFDNKRIVEELGETPIPFREYAYPLLRFAQQGRFRYNYKPWPEKNTQAHSDTRVA